jgi:SAM-dependent methyltransferase
MPNTSIDYFDQMYRRPDPWDYESSWYERRKYALTLAALRREHYENGFEPGCSIGVLTEMLAPRCRHLLAADFHDGALARARHRLRSADHVELGRLEVPRQWPHTTFDLVVISELAYYLDLDAHGRLTDRVHASLAVGGDLVLVHWRGETNYPQTGDDVHRRWTDDGRFEVVVRHREDDFLLDVLQPRPR